MSRPRKICLLAIAPKLRRRATGALLDKVSATAIRTAEVTICIISERLLDRPRQLPHAWRPRLSKTTSTVSLPRVSNVLFMVVHHDIRTEPIHEFNTFSRCAVSTVLAPRTLTNLSPKQLVPNWPAFTTTVGFKVQECPPLQTLKAGLQRWRSCQLFPSEMTKGLSVVAGRRKAYWAYTPGTMPHISDHIYQVAVFADRDDGTLHVCANGPSGTLDENLTLAGVGGDVSGNTSPSGCERGNREASR